MLTQEVGSFFKRFIFTKTNSKDFEYWHGCGIQFEKKHILGLPIVDKRSNRILVILNDCHILTTKL
jgi:hypothetical protein